MDNATIFFENLINAPHVILGYQLNPLCLYHLLWLQHLQSPFLITANRGTIEDVETAVLVCSSSSEEEIILKLNPKGIFRRLKRHLWKRANRKLSLESAAKAFVAYQADFCSLPDFAPSGEDGQIKDEKLPWLLTTAANLIKHTGWTLEEVLRLPVGQVFWLNLTFGYLETGETNVLSDKEKGAIAALSALTDAGKT